MARAVVIALVIAFASMAIGLIWACIRLYVQDRREARTWTEADTRAAQLQARWAADEGNH